MAQGPEVQDSSPGEKNDTDHQLLVATLKVRLAKSQRQAQHPATESRGTQKRESSTVCSRADQQVYGIGGCTE